MDVVCKCYFKLWLIPTLNKPKLCNREPNSEYGHWDNLRVHHSKPVKAWAEEHKDAIELYYLPSYSPELNPEERLNADLKQNIGRKVPARTKSKLRQAATDHMNDLQTKPERVMSFFQDKYVKYAA